jgi:hypothetical protein
MASQHELYILHVALALYSYGPSSCDHTDELTIPLFLMFMMLLWSIDTGFLHSAMTQSRKLLTMMS